YGYGHQNPATLWDSDGEEPRVCTPEDIRGERGAFEFRNIVPNDYAKEQANRVAGNTMGMWFFGPVAAIPMIARLFGGSEDVVESAPLVMTRRTGGPASVTAAMRRPGSGTRLRDAASGRFVSDPANPRSPFARPTDAERRADWRRLANDPNSPLTDAE